MTRSMWRVLSMLAVLVGTLSYTAAAYACDGSHPGHATKAADLQKHNDSKFADFKQGHHGKSDHAKSFRFTTTLTSADSGTCAGATWANDTLKRTYSVRPNSDGSYRLMAFDRGTFTTVAGKSPESCNTANTHHGTVVTAGITGHVGGFLSENITGGTFNPSATCATVCDRAAFVSAFFGASAQQNLDKNVKYVYVYMAKDPSLAFHVWVDAGHAGSTGGLTTHDRGDIATA